MSDQDRDSSSRPGTDMLHVQPGDRRPCYSPVRDSPMATRQRTKSVNGGRQTEDNNRTIQQWFSGGSNRDDDQPNRRGAMRGARGRSTGPAEGSAEARGEGTTRGEVGRETVLDG